MLFRRESPKTQKKKGPRRRLGEEDAMDVPLLPERRWDIVHGKSIEVS
jgi:hypothetical protein